MMVSMSSVVVICLICLVLSSGGGAFMFFQGNQTGGKGGATAAGGKGGGKGGGGKGGGAGKSTAVCAAGMVGNRSNVCVPIEIESPVYGSQDGTNTQNECTAGHYISAINVGYDDANMELKYASMSCTDGQEWAQGRMAPSGILKKVLSTVTMGITDIAMGDSGYENQTFVHPHNPGFDKAALVTYWGSKGNTFVRGFGSDKTSVFGAPKNGSGTYPIPQDKLLEFNCAAAGEAPVGKSYKVTAVRTFTNGYGVKGLQFKCKLLDNNAL